MMSAPKVNPFANYQDAAQQATSIDGKYYATAVQEQLQSALDNPIMGRLAKLADEVLETCSRNLASLDSAVTALGGAIPQCNSTGLGQQIPSSGLLGALEIKLRTILNVATETGNTVGRIERLF